MVDGEGLASFPKGEELGIRPDLSGLGGDTALQRVVECLVDGPLISFPVVPGVCERALPKAKSNELDKPDLLVLLLNLLPAK